MTDLATYPDDLVAAFQIEGQPVRGRIVRLGAAVDDILGRHDYPEPVANLLGEACALAALVGSALKFEGRLIVQAQGDGPVQYVVVDYDTTGALRGYCRFDAALSGLGDPPDDSAVLRTHLIEGRSLGWFFVSEKGANDGRCHADISVPHADAGPAYWRGTAPAGARPCRRCPSCRA